MIANLDTEMVACLRTSAETWDRFDAQPALQSLPKRLSYPMIDRGLVGSPPDVRVQVSLRKEENYEEASRWATHIALLELFRLSDANWLFLIEDTIRLLPSDLQIIKNSLKPGINLLSTRAEAYVIDKPTATTIINNLKLYYAPYITMLDDLYELKLIEIHKPVPLVPLAKPYWFEKYLPLILSVLLAIVLFTMLCPLNSFFTKQLIRTAEMFTAEEAIVGGQG